MKKNILFMMLFMYAGIFLSGCLSIDKISIFYDINKNLTGNMELKFSGLHSDEEAEADKKKEMVNFYNDYINDGKKMADSWCITNGKIVLIDKTDFRCNAIISGEIKNFPGSIYPITENSNFDIKKDNKTFSVKIDSCKIYDKSAPVEVSVKYNGKILSNNAHHFDEKNNIMTWSGEKMEKTGINFVLEVEE